MGLHDDRQKEEDLLRLWRQGDGVARDELWSRTSHYIRGAVSQSIRSAAAGRAVPFDEDDVLQSTFMITDEKIRSESGEYVIGGQARLATWCIRVAMHLVKNWTRRPCHVPLNPTVEPPDPQLKDATNALIAAEAVDRLRRAITQLPECPDRPLRTILCLRHGFCIIGDDLRSGFHEFTNEQIGERYGRCRAWASKLYLEAHKLLASRLEEWRDIDC